MFKKVKSQKICKSQGAFERKMSFYYWMKVEDTCWRKIKLVYFRKCKNLVFSTSCYKKKLILRGLWKVVEHFFFSCYLAKIQHSLNEWKNEAKQITQLRGVSSGYPKLAWFYQKNEWASRKMLYFKNWRNMAPSKSGPDFSNKLKLEIMLKHKMVC